MNYVIGDTIRLTAGVVDLDGVAYDPPEITVSVITAGGVELLEDTEASRASEGSYYYDWNIQGVSEKANLIAIWRWSGDNIKRMKFKVVPETDY